MCVVCACVLCLFVYVCFGCPLCLLGVLSACFLFFEMYARVRAFACLYGCVYMFPCTCMYVARRARVSLCVYDLHMRTRARENACVALAKIQTLRVLVNIIHCLALACTYCTPDASHGCTCRRPCRARTILNYPVVDQIHKELNHLQQSSDSAAPAAASAAAAAAAAAARGDKEGRQAEEGRDKEL